MIGTGRNARQRETGCHDGTDARRFTQLSVRHETMLWDEYYNMTQWERYPEP